jgi:hypothetical protein
VSSALIAIVILVFSCGGFLLTMRLRHRLPPHHREDSTKALIKIATGMLATLVALILGLLVSSAKDTFDTATNEIMQSGAQIVALDRTLVHYGPQAQSVRDELRTGVARNIERYWPRKSGHAEVANRSNPPGVGDLEEAIYKLSPENESQMELRARAVDQADQLGRSRWLYLEQMENPLPQAFLIILALWLVLLFAGLGLLAPINTTSVFALFTCAISMSAAVFLILEMNHPQDGIIQISSTPLTEALAIISK